MKSVLKTPILKLINFFLLNKLTIRAFNNWYEHTNYKWSRMVESRLLPPRITYTWLIDFGNKKLKFPFRKGERKEIFHFPLSYKINDQPIKVLEGILHKHYPKEVVYFDIGANFGLRSLYYLVNDRQCYLFEPNVECNTITERLFSANQITNGRIVTKIVGAENKVAKFYISHSSYISSAIKEYVEEMQDLKMEIEQDQVTIDSFIEREQLQGKVKIVKIDVEGFEYEVCMGAQQLLDSENMTLLIEILPTTASKSELFTLFKGKGYSLYCIDKAGQLRLFTCKNGFDNINNSIDFLATNDQLLNKKLAEYIS